MSKVDLSAVAAQLAAMMSKGNQPDSPATALPAKANPVKSPSTPKSSPKGWWSKSITLEDGSVLEARVAPKCYGCVGFVSRGSYACIFGYEQRLDALGELFGDGFREIVAEMKSNGLKSK